MSGGGCRLYIEASPGEIRAAVLNASGALVAFHVERIGARTLRDAVFLGRVTRVEKGMGAAFVDIGEDMPGFIGRAKGLREGQAISVQVVREAGGGKGPALGTAPVLAGRYLTLDPARPGLKVSRRLAAGRLAADLEPLKELLSGLAAAGEGYTVRPPAAIAGEAVLKAEVERLRGAWRAIEAAAESASPPVLLHPSPPLVERLLRDAAGQIVIEGRRTFALASELAEREMPDLLDSLEQYAGNQPLFEKAGIEEQLADALAPDVALPGGGGLVIETTEALCSIDVNMGGAGGRLPKEDAVAAANVRAAAEIARQITLRNLAGLIVVDFISMRNKGNRRKVVEALRRGLKGGAVVVDVLGMTPAGLVEVTRQRVGAPLAALFSRPRPRAPEALAEAEACAALRAALRYNGPGAPVLLAAPAVISALEGPLAAALKETGRRLGQPLKLAAEAGRSGFEIGKS
jgi:Rne/Rng family ribonuclease